MKYSFVVIAYNEESNIESCIKSILDQEGLGSSYEVIIVDDGSRDNTRTIVKNIAKNNKNIRLVEDGHNHGRGYGRYIGAEKSTGEFIAMVDADIILPSNWLVMCLEHIKGEDVVGGIAVPDGDVAYVYNQFKLKPKTVMGSTTITGNNGLYRSKVFSKINFDKSLREGEDVDFNHRLLAAGFSCVCIPNLIVEHHEQKSFARSMLWLYQSGVGATRQLLKFKEIRTPDIAFAGTFFALAFACVLLWLTRNGFWFILPLACLFITSTLHLRGKFSVSVGRIVSYLGAIVTNAILILCYYLGRLMGIALFFKNRRQYV